MMNLILRSPLSLLTQLALVLAVLGLTACGGGSSSGTGANGPADPDAVKQEQPPLYFSQAQVTMSYGDTPAQNQLFGGAGEGPVTYTSSDASIAAVNELTGRLDIRKAGEVTISAEKAADANNFSAQASYQLTINGGTQDPLVFTHGAIEQFIDETPASNTLSGGSGSGQTVFSSSDPTIVLVDSTSGELTFLDDGTVTITAYRGADERYQETSTSYSVTVSKYPQDALVFAESELTAPVSVHQEANPLTGGSGDGAFVYSSADPEIATIDPVTGEALPMASGSVTIIGTKLENDYYAEAQTEYTLSVFDVLTDVAVDVGVTDTRVTWSAQVESMDIIRTPYDCFLDDVISCRPYTRNTIEGQADIPYYENTVSLDNSAYFIFESTAYQSQPLHIEAVEQSFLPTGENTLVTAENTLWSFGGQNSQGDLSDAIWASADGIEWQQVPLTLPSALSQLDVVVFNGSVYLACGYSDSYSHTVWQFTATGLNPVATPEIASDTSSHLALFNGSLWLVSSAGIWQSANGSEWSPVTDAPAFSARNDFALFSHGDNLYLLGGQSLDGSDALLQDIWYTTDGTDWQLLSASAAFPAQARAKVVNYADTLYLLGGDTGADNASVYTSTDAITWTLAGSADIGDLTGAAVTVDSDGLALTSAQSSYFWRSQDGITWRTPVNAQLQWLER